MSDRARNVLVGVITAVWAVNFAAGLLPFLEYKPDQAVNGIFMVVVGSIFGYNAIKGVRGERGQDPPPPAPPTPSAPPRCPSCGGGTDDVALLRCTTPEVHVVPVRLNPAPTTPARGPAPSPPGRAAGADSSHGDATDDRGGV